MMVVEVALHALSDCDRRGQIHDALNWSSHTVERHTKKFNFKQTSSKIVINRMHIWIFANTSGTVKTIKA